MPAGVDQDLVWRDHSPHHPGKAQSSLPLLARPRLGNLHNKVRSNLSLEIILIILILVPNLASSHRSLLLPSQSSDRVPIFDEPLLSLELQVSILLELLSFLVVYSHSSNSSS